MNPNRRAFLFSSAGLALVLGILASWLVVSRFWFQRLDLSSGRVYSLSRGTKAVLGRIKDPLIIRVYFTPRLPPPWGITEQYLRDLLAEYRGAGRGLVRVEFADPGTSEARRREALAAGIVPVPVNVLSRDKFEAADAFMGAVFLYQGRREVLPVVDDPDGLEYALTRRLKRLVDPKSKTAGFSSGHGEKTPDDPAARPLFDLIREQMRARPVALDKPLPAGLDALWVVEPTSRLKPAELDALRTWVDSGGTLGVVAGRRTIDLRRFSSSPLENGVPELLADWGLDLLDGLVADAQCQNISLQSRVGRFTAVQLEPYPFMPVAKRLNSENPATRALDSVTLPYAHPIEFRAGSGGRYTSLVDSSRMSWYQAKARLAPGVSVDELRAGRPGPFSLAGLLDRGKGRVLVVGSQYLVEPRLRTPPTTTAFFLNLLDWSLQDQDLLSIRAKSLAFRPLRPLSDGRRLVVKELMIFFLPGATLFCGLWPYARRKAALAALSALYADV